MQRFEDGILNQEKQYLSMKKRNFKFLCFYSKKNVTFIFKDSMLQFDITNTFFMSTITHEFTSKRNETVTKFNSQHQ